MKYSRTLVSGHEIFFSYYPEYDSEVESFDFQAATRHARAYFVTVSSCASMSATPLVFTAHKVSGRQHEIGNSEIS